MEQEHWLILELLDEGKITVPEALELLKAMDASVEENTPEPALTVQLCLN